ncbi:tagatose-diphosphate aldolase [Diplodia corticola]|uniref:Fructose-bisphosphate aldolase n=1 Tax=Diplodia corticola TaxID=236234 RepID=A0A1J9SIP2_9PEZI|nr:tagatose-diphosphate aldolase [Diplodia corticola]OJD40231.1 tagatose-diphosphate aldolase [Diplodia corticola]
MSTSWKTSNRTLQILRAAEAGRYGVLAAIAYNTEQILGLVRAAVRARSPLILQFFPWAITYSDGVLVRAAADAIRQLAPAGAEPVPIAIHLDHAQDEALIRRAADELPFDSIMVDMSRFDRDENLAKTRELVAYCHERRIATEAEPGRIEGGEDGVADTAGLEGSMTTEGEVADFVATGVDVLAPAVGNVHGEYGPAGPRLDFGRLDTLVSLAKGKVHIALHGTNGFEPELMKKCIAAGVSKINVNRLVLDDYSNHVAAQAGKIPQTVLMEEGTEKVVSLTMEWMRHCGSAGKA